MLRFVIGTLVGAASLVAVPADMRAEPVPKGYHRQGPCQADTPNVSHRYWVLSDRFSLVCSATWEFNGKCSGGDMWDQWTVTGQTTSPDAFVRPWLDQPITVFGYELIKFDADPKAWFMVGSAIQPDAQVWLAPGENHSKNFWPAGMGQPWPKRVKDEPGVPVQMIDLHGWCPKGTSAKIMLTIYYTPAWDAKD